VLRTYLDVLDERHPPGTERAVWVDAWHEAVDSPVVLGRMLDELRASQDEADRDVKVPRYPPPGELRVVDP
jgi:hypothetical protein